MRKLVFLPKMSCLAFTPFLMAAMYMKAVHIMYIHEITNC